MYKTDSDSYHDGVMSQFSKSKDNLNGFERLISGEIGSISGINKLIVVFALKHLNIEIPEDMKKFSCWHCCHGIQSNDNITCSFYKDVKALWACDVCLKWESR